VGEPGGELFHLAFGSRHFFFEEHLEVRCGSFGGGRLQWARRSCHTHELFDLAEDPWIRWRHTSYHYGVAAGLGYYGAGVFGRADVAVADHGNLDGLLDGGDPFPAGVSAVALLAGAGVEGNGSEAATFGPCAPVLRRRFSSSVHPARNFTVKGIFTAARTDSKIWAD